MPRNVDGTPEIRQLFASIDELSRAVEGNLLSADAQHLTERGRKAQRNYENWRTRKLVPDIRRGSPPKAIDAPYVARFLRLTDGSWLPNTATVLHIFAEGIPCRPELVREAMPSLSLPIDTAELDDIGTVSLDDVVEAVVALIHDKGHGNGKNWRESSDGASARSLKKALTTGKAALSVNHRFVDDDAKDKAQGPSPRPTLAFLLAPLLSHYVGPLDASDLYEVVEPFPGLDYSAVFQSPGIDVPEFSTEDMAKNREYLLELAAIVGPALDRLRDDPDSIVAKINQLRPMALLVARVFPTQAWLFGIRTSSNEPRYIALLDTLVIVAAAILTERDQSK